MSFIHWKDSYSIGNDPIDTQHKKLILLINQYDEAVNNGGSPSILREIIDGMVEYAKFHFLAEERLMVQIDFAGYEKHRDKHRFLLAEIDDFLDKYSNGDLWDNEKLLCFLKDWVIDHIINDDMEIKKAVEKFNESFTVKA